MASRSRAVRMTCPSLARRTLRVQCWPPALCSTGGLRLRPPLGSVACLLPARRKRCKRQRCGRLPVLVAAVEGRAPRLDQRDDLRARDSYAAFVIAREQPELEGTCQLVLVLPAPAAAGRHHDVEAKVE